MSSSLSPSYLFCSLSLSLSLSLQLSPSRSFSGQSRSISALWLITLLTLHPSSTSWVSHCVWISIKIGDPRWISVMELSLLSPPSLCATLAGSRDLALRLRANFLRTGLYCARLHIAIKLRVCEVCNSEVPYVFSRNCRWACQKACRKLQTWLPWLSILEVTQGGFEVGGVWLNILLTYVSMLI